MGGRNPRPSIPDSQWLSIGKAISLDRRTDIAISLDRRTLLVFIMVRGFLPCRFISAEIIGGAAMPEFWHQF